MARPAKPGWLRRGGWPCGGRLRAGFAGQSGCPARVLDVLFPHSLEDQGAPPGWGLESKEFATQCWAEMTPHADARLADGADLLLTGLIFEQPAANVAEYPRHSVGHATFLPAAAPRPALAFPAVAIDAHRNDGERLAGVARDEEGRGRAASRTRRPRATGPAPRRIAERRSLEIQAYDEVCFPGLAAEWAKSRRPATLCRRADDGVATDADDEVASWIAAGTPPIYFGFGSMPLAISGRHRSP